MANSVGEESIRRLASWILSVVRQRDIPSLRSELQTYTNNYSSALAAPKYIVQQASSLLTNEQDLSALATGYMKVTTSTGVVSSQTTPIPSADGGTGVNNAGRTLTISTNSGTLAFGAASKTLTISNNLTLAGTDGKSLTLTGALTVGADTSITGGGTLALGGFTLTVPDTGTVPLGTGTANQLTYWSGTNTVTGSVIFTIDTTTHALAVNTEAASTQGQMTLGYTTSGDYFQIIHISATQMQMNKLVASGQALIDINPSPTDGTSSAAFRFFRSTNTSGLCSFQIFKGDGTGTFNGVFAGNSNSYICSDNSNFGIGTNSPATLVHILRPDATTNAVVNVLTLGHGSTGTPAAGFGVGVPVQLESSTTVNRDAGRIQTLWATATDASRASRMVLSTYYTTTEREGLRIESNSSAALIGFLGATAVARQTVTGSRGGNAALASALTALANLGLITDSSSA